MLSNLFVIQVVIIFENGICHQRNLTNKSVFVVLVIIKMPNQSNVFMIGPLFKKEIW